MAAGRKKFTSDEVTVLFKGSISLTKDEFEAEEIFSEFIGVNYCQLEEEKCCLLVS